LLAGDIYLGVNIICQVGKDIVIKLESVKARYMYPQLKFEFKDFKTLVMLASHAIC